MRKGILAAAFVYLLWGLLPIYWKALAAVPSPELMVHRVVWSLPIALLLWVTQGQASRLGQIVRRPATWLPFLVSAALLSVNWLTYLWANNNGHIVETSLGYFMNPLVNVVLGMVFLRERLRTGQWVAVGLAFAGVAYLTLSYGQPPWISLILAFSFGFYALMRKTAALGSIEGLTLELSIMFVPAAAFLLGRAASGAGAFGRLGVQTDLMLIVGGVLTCIPLVLFAFGARRVPLTTMGLLQYTSPTLQFLIGVFLFGEPFPPARLIGFGFIWAALAVYTYHSWRSLRRS
ncbi:MAG: EamA family transporter RarD [Anaerolineae bacterium]|nr:EamA family transporter RarD [Anaerolineae bacterium]